MTYVELQQRRQRVEAELAGVARSPSDSVEQRILRALLDDADPSAHFVLGSIAFSAALPMYDRALSIAEEELGL